MKARMRTRAIRDHMSRSLGDERGVVIVVVMVFCLIFMILGVALFLLTTGEIRATETERKDVKAFNVTEAGVDAGMLALKLDWPMTQYDYVMVEGGTLKDSLQEANPELYDPERSDASEFLEVFVYDNSVETSPGSGVYETVTLSPDLSKQLMWDANGDGRMFVEATSNVQDARHRIVLLAERQIWALYFPISTPFFAFAMDSNGIGLEIEIEDGTPPVYYDVHDVLGKGVNPGDGVEQVPSATDFNELITDSLLRSLLSIATTKGTHFVDRDAEAEAYLLSTEAPGSIVYIEHAEVGTVNIDSGNQTGAIGSTDQPVVVVIDAPDGSIIEWDMAGTVDFYGILVVLGDVTLKGTSSTHGAIFCEGTLLNKGAGSSPELFYNVSVINNINRMHVLSVNIVPNTWEEYTTPKAE